MSNIVDKIFAEVCLDERVSDGIFRMDEEQHMNALRDYFVKKGIAKEDAIHVTNRMVEGKYPERQAYRSEDGILVTWPSPQHKAKAMKENPGKYVEQNPKPSTPSPQKKEIPSQPKEPVPVDTTDEKPEKQEKDTKLPKSSGNIFNGESPKIKQGDKELSVEPPRGSEKAEAPPPPVAPTSPPVQKTPERKAAEKEVAKQIIYTDDTNLSKIEPPMNESCRKQLTELLLHADKLNYQDAVLFLAKYIN